MEEQEVVSEETTEVSEGSVTDGETGAAVQEEETPVREYLNVDEIGDKYVTVKVNGEEMEVPVSEALSGYSRTQDYTQKTQAAAAERQAAQDALRLQQAFQADPAFTVQFLARQAGMSVEEFVGLSPAQQQRAIDDGGDDTSFDDPLEQRLNQMERVFAEQQAERELQGAIQNLKQNYQADDETTREVVARALQMNMGPSAFDHIYKSIAFERMTQGQQAAQQEAAQRQSEEEAKRQAAAAQQGTLVGSGQSANGVTSEAPANHRYSTPGEAASAAWDKVYGS